MDLGVQGRQAIVTGGSRGIGKATALALAREGCDVAICARNDGPLRESAAELRSETGQKIFAMVCDTLSPESINQFIERAAGELGGVQIPVNNAARVGRSGGTIETVQDADILRDFEEKVVGYLRGSRAAVPHMKAAGFGRIVNLSGGTGRSPGVQVRAGLRNIATINLTKSMANDLGAFGINVNAVYPGMTITEDTAMRHQEQAAREGTTVDQVMSEAVERSVIKHMVTAEEVANVIAFLCSPLAIGVTGEATSVMGGASHDVHV